MTSVNGSAQTLQPAAALAQSTRRFPGESTQYRTARNALLAEEIELRRHIERVAAQRRALPAGGEVPQDYRFEGEHGPATLSQMFGDHDTLITYNWMFGPKRERPCPMCTSLLGALDGEMADILQRVGLCGDRPRANRAAGGIQEGARLAPPAALFVGWQQLQSRLRQRRSGCRRQPCV